MPVISICPRSRVYREGARIVFCLRNGGEERIFSTGLNGSKSDMLGSLRDDVVRLIKVVYCIIVELNQIGERFGIDEVVNRFKSLSLSECSKYDGLIGRYGNDFPIDGSIAKISTLFRRDFKIVYDRNEGLNISVLNFISGIVAELQAAGDLSTSRSYRSLMLSLSDFMGSGRKSLTEIDSGFIHGYESHLKKRSLSPETIAFYMRTLRTALKTASARGLCLIDTKWFDGVHTSVGSKIKRVDTKVLDHATLSLLHTLELDGNLALARDLFVFAFCCRGMELIDVLNLKPNNVKGEYLVYNRRRKGHQQKVRLEPEALRIIEKYSRPGATHLFPPLEGKGMAYFNAARNNIALSLKAIGNRIGCPCLSFSYNRSTWQAIADESCLVPKLVG